jgi:hypothetical protein
MVGLKMCLSNRESKKDRKYNGQKTKDKRTNNDPQNTNRKLEIKQHEPHWKP